ncbi:MAG: hypothetical protein KGN35_02165 [Betaproteobacteria bacterium]|nr:hypothetical protein [Betaproteobacteria bacterium]
MKKIRLMCLTIVLCGIFSVSLVDAEGDGGNFDGGFDSGGDFGSDYSGDHGGDFDSGGYSDFSDPNGSDPSDAFYQHDQFNQPENNGFIDSASHGGYSDQADMIRPSNDFAAENNANHNDGGTGTVPNNDGLAHEPMKKELPDQSADTAQHAEQNSDSAQTPVADHRNAADTNPGAHSATGTADSIQSTAAADSNGTAGNASAATDSSTHHDTVTQTDPSMQNVNIQNNTHIDQNTGHDNHHHHHGGGHHYYDNFGLGFGLGLGMGIGVGSFGYYSPFAPFGYYGGFGAPFSSFGFYSNRVGVGFYNNFAGFGPYRYFEPYYPLGGFLAASPVFLAPLIAPARAPTYVQRQDVSRPPVVPQQKNYWYYCRNPEGYYPYIKQCAGQWIKVPP